MQRFLIPTVAFFATVAQATVYHVAPPPAGDDRNPGTNSLPWATLHKAAATLTAGDTVLVHGGTYRISEPIVPQNSGTSNAWITYQGIPGETPVIDAGDAKSRRSRGGAFWIDDRSYIRIVNLRVVNSYSAGIMIQGGRPQHIDVIGCATDRTFCPGIGVWNADYIRIISNEVTGANARDMNLSQRRIREAPHEAISSGGGTHLEVAYNHVHHCHKEGIDIKEVSAHVDVHHNYVHDLPRQGLYVDAWFGLLQNVEFHHNIVHDCEWGMAISVEGRASRLENLRVHHNLFYANRASGIFFARWGHDGPRAHIAIYNNTVVDCGRQGHWAGATGGIDMKSPNVSDCLIMNNLCAGNARFQIATFDNPGDANDLLAEQNIRIAYNLSDVFRSDSRETHYGPVYGLLGDNAVTGDPRFVNAGDHDYHLRKGSPAIDAGCPDARFTDPDGSTNDIGAFYFGGDDDDKARDKAQESD